MKAQVIEKFGGTDVFEMKDIARPEAGAGEVLIKVKATSVNPVDAKIRSGHLAALGAAFPAILHGDVAGIIETVGTGVTAFKPGDEVYGCAGGLKGFGGALAEFMVADARLIAKKPRNLDFAQAAALPLVALTAWEGLVDKASFGPGAKVLVHGGTGGVGHVALQLAKARGAYVVATVSGPEKAKIARDLGADATIDYRNEAVETYVQTHTGGRGFDVVFDTIGGETLARSIQAAAPNGHVISSQSDGKHDLTPAHLKGLSIHNVLMLLPMLTGENRAHHGEILREIATLAEAGKIRPLIAEKRFTLREVGDAHAYLEDKKAVGKVVVTI